MHVDLRYGKGAYRLPLDPDWDVTVIRKPEMPVLPDPVEAIRTALARPVNAHPLAEEARGRKSACILVCDITRPVPNGLFLPPMVRTLLDAGVPASGITIMVATGLHRPNEGERDRDLQRAEEIGQRPRDTHFPHDIELGGAERFQHMIDHNFDFAAFENDRCRSFPGFRLPANDTDHNLRLLKSLFHF